MGFKFTQSKTYKVVMNYVYGWGACAVIIGALFKIMHFPGATYVLTTGMLVEALIFFLSAFEPQMDHYKWTNVFPELNPDYKGEIKQKNFGGGSGISLDVVDEDTKLAIKEGFNKIASSVENLNDITESAKASVVYKDAMLSAAEAITNVSENSSQISSKISDLNVALTASSEGFNKIGDSVTNYASFIENFEKDFKPKAESFTGNVSTLNSIYEMQIKSTNEYVSSFNTLQDEIKNISSNVSNTVESTKLYRVQSELLGKNISNLNDVYGNMLSVFSNRNN